jgi:hypothetical protein
MAVAHDAVSESHTGITGSVSQASFTWNHTPADTPRGVLVYTFVNANADDATAVTYGGVAMTAVPAGRAVDTANEPGDCKAWFLGAAVPTGVQAVEVTRTNNTNEMYAVALTVTAGADTEPFGTLIEQENQTLAEENIDDGSTGVNSIRYAGINFGGSNLPGIGANTTNLIGIDYGLRVTSVVRETTAGQGSRPVGFDVPATSEDVAAVYLAVREVVAAVLLPILVTAPYRAVA